jgi:uncharacterized protein (DUF342 family)
MSAPRDISVRVTGDGRRAEVSIPAGMDPAYLTPSLLGTIVAEAGVQITPEVTRRLAAMVEAYRAAPRDLVADCAQAVEPIHGTDGAWLWEPGFDPAARPSAGADDQRTDHYASRIRGVAAGTPIARLTPPTEGTDGRDVTGAVLPARRGSAAGLRPGEGLEVRPDGAVVARVDGVLTVAKGVVSISSVLEVEGAVDFTTGNIDFKGDVRVGESVKDGFQILATGHVEIRGPVEGARIVCGGTLTCHRGIASARRAIVEVGGDATVGYLRNVTGVFRGTLTCRGEIEHSTVIVGGACHGEQARLIGGATVLTGVSRLGILGSPDWIPTLVSVGDLPLAAMELKRLDLDAARLQKGVAAKEEAIRHLESCRGGKTARAREQLTELQYELGALRQEAAAVEARRAVIQEELRRSRAAELHVVRQVYPKVRIQHAETAYEFERELKGPLQFQLDSRGIILVKVSSQEARPITDFARSVRAAPGWGADLEPMRRCA